MRRTRQVERKPKLAVQTDGQLDDDQVAAILRGRPRIVVCLHEAKIIIQSHGWFRVYAQNQEYGQRIADWLKGNFGKEVREGETFLGLVTRQMMFGSFLILTIDGYEGLLHYSRYPARPFVIGDFVEVQVDEVDRMGRVNLTAV